MTLASRPARALPLLRRPWFALALVLACGDAGGSGSESASDASTSEGGSEATGASETGDSETGGAEVDYEQPGPHPVGNTRFQLDDASSGRSLTVEVWYPADASAAASAAQGHPIEAFVAEGPDREAFEQLLLTAPDPGTRRATSSAFEGAPASGDPWPVVAFSHCHGCTRFSKFSIAERLASHGIAVVAPDHQGNTLFDALADMNAPIDGAFLATRAGDVRAVLDAVLDPASEVVPALVRGRFDPARVGAMGHSFGAATTGLVAQEDPRIIAAMPIAAPVESPILPGPMVASIDVPLLYVLAVEDNSILTIGNNILKNNFSMSSPPAWLVSVADAGHWGFSDICGITEALHAGCGEGLRQTDDEPFTYLDVTVGRAIVSAYATAFFDHHLRGAAAGLEYLSAARPEALVTLEART